MTKIIPLLAGAAVLAMVGATGCAQKGPDGEVYKRVPAKQHQTEHPDGHKDGARCYYDEKGDVYFCSK